MDDNREPAQENRQSQDKAPICIIQN